MSCNFTIPGQSCLASCSLFPSSLMNKLYLPAPKDFIKLTNKLRAQKPGFFNSLFHHSRISQERWTTTGLKSILRVKRAPDQAGWTLTLTVIPVLKHWRSLLYYSPCISQMKSGKCVIPTLLRDIPCWQVEFSTHSGSEGSSHALLWYYGLLRSHMGYAHFVLSLLTLNAKVPSSLWLPALWSPLELVL